MYGKRPTNWVELSGLQSQNTWLSDRLFLTVVLRFINIFSILTFRVSVKYSARDHLEFTGL